MERSRYQTAFGGTNVVVRNDDVSGAMRKLRKILEKDNRQKDLAKHEYFEKGSITRARARKAAVKRQKKRRRDQNLAGMTNDGRCKSNLSFMKSKRKRRAVLDGQAPRHKVETD